MGLISLAGAVAVVEAVNGAIMPIFTCGGPVPPPACRPVCQHVAT